MEKSTVEKDRVNQFGDTLQFRDDELPKKSRRNGFLLHLIY